MIKGSNWISKAAVLPEDRAYIVAIASGTVLGRRDCQGVGCRSEAAHTRGRWTVGPLETCHQVKDQICSAVVGTADFNTMVTASLQLEHSRAAR